MGHQQGLAGVQPQWTATIWVRLSSLQEHTISMSALRMEGIHSHQPVRQSQASSMNGAEQTEHP